jgi:hypothetical protein
MSRVPTAALAGCALAFALLAPAAFAGTPPSCGSRTVAGTGVVTAHAGPGASCLLAAFAACTPAVYELSSFGIDTIDRSRFTVTPSRAPSHGCFVAVASSFQVVPQPARAAPAGRCTALARHGGEIVATGCRGGDLAATISLTGPRSR